MHSPTQQSLPGLERNRYDPDTVYTLTHSRRGRRRTNVRTPDGVHVEKLCCTCKTWLPLDYDHFTRIDCECRTCAAARMNRWRKQKPAKANAQTARRRARNHEIPGTFTAQDQLNLFDQWGNTCLRCGATGVQLISDHVIPTTQPKCTHDTSNRQPLCPHCNRRKGIKSTDFRPSAAARLAAATRRAA